MTKEASLGVARLGYHCPSPRVACQHEPPSLLLGRKFYLQFFRERTRHLLHLEIVKAARRADHLRMALFTSAVFDGIHHHRHLVTRRLNRDINDPRPLTECRELDRRSPKVLGELQRLPIQTIRRLRGPGTPWNKKHQSTH